MQSELLTRLGITVPVVLAPMARAGGSALSAAVSNAGGLGLLPVWQLEPAALDSGIRWIGSEAQGSYRPTGVPLAGQSVGLVRRQQPAAEIVAEIWAEARATMRALGQRAL